MRKVWNFTHFLTVIRITRETRCRENRHTAAIWRLCDKFAAKIAVWQPCGKFSRQRVSRVTFHIKLS
jgi:hypothetical protein